MVSHVCVLPAVGWTKVISTFMYGDIMYYIHHTPVFDMNYDNPKNPRVEMGIGTWISTHLSLSLSLSPHSLTHTNTHKAYCSVPRDGQREPKTFVCNVGHLEQPSLQDADWLQTNMHTYRMVKHLANDPRAGEKGFVADVICEFWSPASKKKNGDKDDPRHIRQVNLSAWTNPKSAHDWYVASRAHADVVKMLKAEKKGPGTISKFSSMLAHLSPTKGFPTRWFSKCKSCGGLQKDFPKKKNCNRCGEDVTMPYFM